MNRESKGKMKKPNRKKSNMAKPKKKRMKRRMKSY